MTSRKPPQCLTCQHWMARPMPQPGGPQVCDAFPDGIPEAIWWNQVDHRQAQPGDNGVRWTPADGAEFPDWAMSTEGGGDGLAL